MTFDIAVVMDPIGSVNIKKDSTFAMLLEAQRRGHRLHYLLPGTLGVEDGHATARASRLAVRDDPAGWFELADEGLEGRRIARHQGRRAALGELESGQLLVHVAQALRIVHHERAGALREAEQLGVVQVVGIDRWVGAHQHDVPRAEHEL